MAAEEKKGAARPHAVVLENRRSLTATGVSNVDSFDDKTVVVYTDAGVLTVTGNSLVIGSLSVETGELSVTGEIDDLSYSDGEKQGGLSSRLFK